MSEQQKKSGSGIEGYRLLKKLGKGGMATVYLGIQECFDRKVAIKVMHPNPSDPSFGERFIREAKIIAKLSQPNIVPVYDVGISGKHNYMAMEYLPGGDLTSRIEQGISTSEAIRITKEVAAALDYAHSKGYVHRDVKPDNIMFKEDGTAVLTDFGIARPNTPETNMTQIGKVIGTPKYMSPEQSKGDELDGRSDLYALGIMLYEMLTGNVPFDGNNAFDIGIKHLKDPVPPLPENLQQFQPVINQLLAKNINKRVQTGKQLIDVLSNVDVRINKDDTQQRSMNTMEADAVTLTDYKTDDIAASIANHESSETGGAGMHADKSDRVEEIVIPKDRTGPIIIGVVCSLALIGLLFGAVWFAPQIAPNSFLMGPHNTLMSMLYPEREQLRQALANAQTAMDEERYLSPSDNSALFFYNEVLSIDTENTEALAGLDEIIRIYIEQAMVKIDDNAFTEAEQLLMDAKQVKGETPEIIAALDALDQKKLALANAEDAAAAEAARLAAEEKARKEALLAKQRAEEQAARDAAEQARLAAEAEAEAARLKAEEEARLAAEAEAEAARLAAEEEARQKALQEQAKQRMLKLQVTGLLNKADTYMARGDYRSPAQENALEKYLTAKELDPSNERAQAGIEQVVTILIPEIDELLKAQQFSMAQNLFEQLIAAAPDHPDLIEIGQAKGW